MSQSGELSRCGESDGLKGMPGGARGNGEAGGEGQRQYCRGCLHTPLTDQQQFEALDCD